MSKPTFGFRSAMFLVSASIVVFFCAQCSGALPVADPIIQPPPTDRIETAYPAAHVTVFTEPVMPYPAPPVQPSSHLELWQTITDPQKLWALLVPPDWLPGKSPAEYQGEDGFVRISYLAEMAFMQRSQRVCDQIANSLKGAGRQVHLAGNGQLDICALPPPKSSTPAPTWLIVHHPEAEAAYRFAWIEIDYRDVSLILETLQKLPVKSSAAQRSEPIETPQWLDDAKDPGDVSLEEIPVEGKKPGQGVSMNEQFRLPAVAIPKRKVDSSAESIQLIEEFNQTLAAFDYAIEIQEPASSERYRLLHQEQVALEDITHIPHPVLSASESQLALVVSTASSGSWLVQDTGISQWNRSDLPWRLAGPVFVGEDLLIPYWDSPSGQVQVRKGDKIIYGFTTFLGASSPVQIFTAWEAGWLMEINGFLIQDGQSLNDKAGYDELFGWRLLNSQPFFFFRRGEWVGIFYAGQVLPLVYEDVFHYGCCGYTQYNPSANEQGVGFFGLREGQWYYVIVGVGE